MSVSATEVLLVTAPGCLFCEDAHTGLGELATEFGIEVREVDALSPDGFAVVERFRPTMLPVILVDGELFSSGRLPRTKLRRQLERGTAA